MFLCTFLCTLLTSTYWTLNLFGIFGGTATIQTFDRGSARYRLMTGLYGQNLTNRANDTGYSGTMNSPHFGIATAVAGTRKIEFLTNFSF
jgi:hypothetical protein